MIIKSNGLLLQALHSMFRCIKCDLFDGTYMLIA